MASIQRWSFGVWFKELQEKGRDWVTQTENSEGIKETKQLKKFHFTTFSVPVKCPVQSRMKTAMQYKLSSAAPKSGPLLQGTPGILMLRYSEHTKSQAKYSLLQLEWFQTFKPWPDHVVNHWDWVPTIKHRVAFGQNLGRVRGVSCPQKEKCSRTLHKNPTAQWKAGTLQGSVSKWRRYSKLLLCTQY